MLAGERQKETALKNGPLKRGAFFYYWKSFCELGMLGLVDKAPGIFRSSKIGLANESRIVIDKIQFPARTEKYYCERLKYKQISVDRSAISKIFSKWEVSKFNSGAL